MKTLLIILGAVILSLGASAQHKVYYRTYHPRVYISPFSYGIGYGYPYYGYPAIGYPYGYPYYEPRVPYKLQLEIQSIKTDYRNQIRDVRHDKNLSHSKRRQEIRSLKGERDQAIIDAQRNYRKSPRPNNKTQQDRYNADPS
jgi:hypothetical protein